MLGLNVDFHPWFVRHYAELADVMTKAVKSYIDDIKAGKFPLKEESY
jgi:3-methyl-2-oxobutanoate hydroxymethyltransferase